MLYKKRNCPSLFIIFASLITAQLFLGVPLTYGEDTTIQLQAEGVRKPVTAVSDELIIKYKDDVTAFEKRKFKEANELETERVKRNPLKEGNIEKVQLDGAVTAEALEAIVEKLEDHPAVESQFDQWARRKETLKKLCAFS